MNSSVNFLDFRSINISIVLYAMLYTFGIFIQEPVQKYGLISSKFIPVLVTVYFSIILLISGYVCGRLAKSKGFYNGTIVGIGSIIVSVIGISSIFGIKTLSTIGEINIIGLLLPMLLAGTGGALAEYWPRRQ